MIQFIILGYLLYEILRLAQRPDVSAAKFCTPDEGSAPAPAPVAPMASNAPTQIPPPPEGSVLKSEETTAKSG